jgi:hypothetical protein
MVFTISTQGLPLEHLLFSMGPPSANAKPTTLGLLGSNLGAFAHMRTPFGSNQSQAVGGRRLHSKPFPTPFKLATPFKVGQGPAARKLSATNVIPDLPMHVVKGSIKLSLFDGVMAPVVPKASSSAHVAHGVLMALAWGVCMPLGILNNRLFRGKYQHWRLVHKVFQGVGMLFSVIAFIIAISTFKITTDTGYVHMVRATCLHRTFLFYCQSF